MQRLATSVLAFLCSTLVGMSSALAAPLTVSATSIAVTVGQQAQLQVAGGSGRISVEVGSSDIAKATLASGKITVTGVKAGKTEMKVRDRSSELKVAILVSATTTAPPPPSGAAAASRWTVLASNDLGMHCADLDYQVFSILPPFNVVHAQVVLPGTATTKPRVLSATEADVFYRAVSTPAGSVNTTSQSSSLGPKTNFWNPATLPDGTAITLGGMGYRPLYPGVDVLGMACPSGGPCASVLDLFALPPDKGLPVPDPAKLPALAAGQQWMPGPSNVPQKFGRYDADLPFFAGFGFGTTVKGANWFSADGIPILPVDDAGKTNPYPLMRIQAVAKGVTTPTASNTKGSLDIVLPVASEADCRNCHNGLSGIASVFAKTTMYADGKTTWPIMQDDLAPGPDKANNAAKINILRLHDAKHGALYTSSAVGAPSTPCMSGKEPSCLDQRRAIQCSQCHYSPALDLAQVGPINETSQGANGRQQLRHVSMSRAMHYNHGQYADLFPAMPLPKATGRTLQTQADILDQTCYQCHPGKQTKCLRGAMGAGGVVCQDCHGDMKQVGNDFTANFPVTPGVGAAGKRVPWAMEPKCQSCHVGDARTVTTMNRTDQIVAADGIRLLLAYPKSAATSPVLTPNESPTSRFAEDQKLYRLSKTHGLACNGCHGATHAEWPNPNPAANDNIAATQLQGHSGTLIECNTCHAAGSLGLTLSGPHGMHPVNDARWTRSHSDVAEKNLDSCRACHGMRGQGTVLARVAATRTLAASEEGTRTVTLQKGTQVRCDLCHENKL
jgi:hypothetical protein